MVAQSLIFLHRNTVSGTMKYFKKKLSKN